MRVAGTTESELIDSGTIVTVLKGRCDRQLVKRVFETNAKLRKKIKHGQTARLLLDMSAVTSTDSGARSASKDIANVNYERIAIVITSPLLSLAAQYIVNRGNIASKTKVFRSRSKAEAWLSDKDEVRTATRDALTGLAASLLTGGIGVISLIGWALDNAYLMRTISTFRAINPLAAVGLIILGAGLYGLWRHNRRLARAAGLTAFGLGVITLTPIPIDGVLFSHRLAVAGSHTQLADSAAVCFIMLGVIMVVRSQATIWLRLRFAMIISVFLIAAFNIFGQLYAYDFIYGLSGSFVMAFQLAIGFVITAVALLLLYSRNTQAMFTRISTTGWAVISVLIILQAATYAVWSTTISYNRTQSNDSFNDSVQDLRILLNNRIAGYTEVLRGYSGLFAASDNVSEADFKQYYRALDLKSQYPGFKSVTYVAIVPNANLSQFQRQQRLDRSSSTTERMNFTVWPATSVQTHYIITYYGDSNSSNNLGLDLATIPGRAAIFEAASSSQAAYLSGSVKIAADAEQPSRQGFFIAVPVKTRTAAADIGYVNTVFYYDVFFQQFFNEDNNLPYVRIVDTKDGSQLYQSGRIAADGSMRTFNIAVANRAWQVTAAVPSTYGNSDAQRYLPRSILITGQFLSICLILIFWQLNRGRRQALRLADSITEDLNFERDNAIAVRDKDDAVLSSIGDAVFAIDTGGKLTLFNPAAARLSGHESSGAIGKAWQNVLKIINIADGTMVDAPIKAALAGKLTSNKANITLVRKNGTRVPIAISAAPIRRRNMTIDGVIVIFRDISSDLELDKAKTEFVSLASHQLRTPLSAINWYSEILLGGDAGNLNDEQRSYVTEIFEGNQRMIELVNALLDVSRLELNKFTNTPADTVLKEQVDSLHAELEGDIETKQLTYAQTIALDVPAIHVDPKLSRIILQNLLSNAVKYTPAKGTVTLDIRLASLDEAKLRHLHGTAYVLISVKDNGFGIPAAQQDQIFGKMFRADNVQSMDVEGTGLGLYLVKEVVERLGGTIWFESMESIGTTFFVLLPLITKEH